MSLLKSRTSKPVPAPSAPTIVVAPFEDRLLRLPEVVTMVGLAKSTIYKLIAEGKFPPTIKRTMRASTWKLSDIQAYIRGDHATASGASATILQLVRHTREVRHD